MQLLIILFLSWILQPYSPVQNGPEQGTETGNRIALSFSHNPAYLPSQQELDDAFEMGVDLIEFNDPIQFSNRSIGGFHILIGASEKFTSMVQLEQEPDRYLEAARNHFRAFNARYSNQLAAFNLFHFPADYRPGFTEASGSMINQLSTDISLPFYYQSAQREIGGGYGPYRFVSTYLSVSDPVPDIPNRVLYFHPGRNVHAALTQLELVLAGSLDLDDSIILIPADWFFERLDSQPDLKLVFSNYNAGHILPFPYPDQRDTLPDTNWPLLNLLLIWAIVAVLYKFRPIFPDTLFRYLFNHYFFVTDTMENRNRNYNDAFIVLQLHIVISALFFYTFSITIFGGSGLESLSHHFPFLFISGSEAFSFYVMGLAISAISHFIAIFWIFLMNKAMNKIGQTMQLYSWGLLLNLITITLLIFATQMDAGRSWIYTLSILFLFIWFMSFNVAAITGARFLDRFRAVNIVLTFGLHLLIALGVIYLIIMTPSIYDPLELAFWLGKQ